MGVSPLFFTTIGSKIWKIEYWILNIEYWILNIEYWIFNFEYLILQPEQIERGGAMVPVFV